MESLGTIIEYIFGGVMVLCFVSAFISVIYTIIKGIYDKIKESVIYKDINRIDRAIARLHRLQRKYPEVYKAWYGESNAIHLLSEEELIKSLSISQSDWRNKQRMLDNERQLYYKRLAEANELCAKYPNAYREITGRKPIEITPELASEIEDILSKPVPQLSPPAGIVINTPKTIYNEYSLSDSDITKLLETPEIRLSEIENRIITDFDNKYQEICQLYQKGLALYRLKYCRKENGKIDIVAHESEIKELELLYPQYHLYETWEKEQDSFNDTIYEQVKTDHNKWSVESYSMTIEGVGLLGTPMPFSLPVSHVYCGVTWDPAVFLKEGRVVIPAPVIADIGLMNEIASFISEFSNITILVAENGLEDFWEGFIETLKTNSNLGKVPFYSLSDYLEDEQLEFEKVLLLQVVAYRFEIEDACEQIYKLKKNSKPCVACFSYLRGYIDYEIKAIVQEEDERTQKETERIEREHEEKRLHDISHINKDNWEGFREYLRWNGVACLYHFTDRANIKSIKEHGGLYSWKYCEDHNISIPRAGGSDFSRRLDERHNLEDYVRLSFCEDHPMAYRLRKEGYNLVLLKIHVRVAWLKDTLFSDINATDNAHTHGGTLDDLKRIDIEATKQRFVSQESPSFKKHQAEVLVKTFIPLEYITLPNDSSGKGILGSLSLSPTSHNKEEWTVKNIRNFTTEEIEAVESNVIVASSYGRSLQFVLKSGGISYIPMSTTSTKYIGESVDLNIAKIVTLSKIGAGDIYRVEA